MNFQNKKRPEIICRCNEISKEEIEESIRSGSDDLGKIFDKTTAGVGACGGTCRPKLVKMLEQFLNDGTFPATFRKPKKRC